MARGITLSGFSVSPAAMPTSSTAEYAKTTPEVTMTNAIRPVGSRPPLSAITDGPVLAPSTVNRPARKTVPMTRNPMMATTLIRAAQNSISPNSLTLIVFMVSTMTKAMSAMDH
ncbi:Uncharacterised protein [Mycobacteroides abscessus subsp. abscessus]|nr:Uncharacterised protein [Mycobacteroides abscessus subsp. abscessus]